MGKSTEAVRGAQAMRGLSMLALIQEVQSSDENQNRS